MDEQHMQGLKHLMPMNDLESILSGDHYLADKQYRVVVADAAQDLDNSCEETNMIHWLCKLNAAEVAWTV